MPPAIQARVTDLLRKELEGRDRCLEIGIGTGRMALPLHRAGVELAGIDISAAMLERLMINAGKLPFPLAVADATRLPFSKSVFGATFACHVLHLIPHWREAAAEMVRVVRPAGVVLIDLGGWGTGGWQEIADHFVLEAGIERPRPGADDPDELEEAMAALGATLRELETITFVRRARLDELLRRVEEGIYSFTWAADESVRVAAARATRAWAEKELGPPERESEHELTIAWRAYDLP